MIIRMGEGRVRHLLQSLDGVAHLNTEGSDVLVQGGHLRVQSLDRFPNDDRLFFLNLLMQVFIGDAFWNYSLVALNADGAVIGTWTPRFRGFLLERYESLASVGEW